MIVGSYRDLVLDKTEMPIIFQQPDIAPTKPTSRDFIYDQPRGLGGAVFEYENTTGNIIVAVLCTTIDHSGPDYEIEASFEGIVMTRLIDQQHFHSSDPSGPHMLLFGLRDAPKGKGTLILVPQDTDAGYAIIKISEVVDMPEDYFVSGSAYGRSSFPGSVTGFVLADPVIPEGTNVVGDTYIAYGMVEDYEAYPMTANIVNTSIPTESFNRDHMGPGFSWVFSRKIITAEDDVNRLGPNFRFNGKLASRYGGACAIIKGTFLE